MIGLGNIKKNTGMQKQIPNKVFLDPPYKKIFHWTNNMLLIVIKILFLQIVLFKHFNFCFLMRIF